MPKNGSRRRGNGLLLRSIAKESIFLVRTSRHTASALGKEEEKMAGKKTEIIRYTDSSGEEILIPVCTVAGREVGPTVCITAGMHGCEYPGIAAAISFIKTLDPRNVKGILKIIPIANVPSFRKRQMYEVPFDNKDQYDLFPGSKDGSYSDVLVYHLVEDFVKGSDYYIDLHGGDLIEDLLPLCLVHLSGKQEIDSKSLRLAQYFGLPIVVTTKHDGRRPDKHKFYSGASELGIPSVLAEAGRIGQLEDETVALHLDGLQNVLRYIGSIEGCANAKRDIVNYADWFEVRIPTDGIFYSRVKLGEEIRKGQSLGVVEDFFGNERASIPAPDSGRVLVLVTSPAVGSNDLLMIVGCGGPRKLETLL